MKGQVKVFFKVFKKNKRNLLEIKNKQTTEVKMHLQRIVKTISILVFLALVLCFSCNNSKEPTKVSEENNALNFSKNILDYRITPKDSVDKSGLMFSDQGAWFAYSLPKTIKNSIGFSGPFLMTQQNGVWSSSSLSKLHLSTGVHNEALIDFENEL